jgi:hypothetical protein
VQKTSANMTFASYAERAGANVTRVPFRPTLVIFSCALYARAFKKVPTKSKKSKPRIPLSGTSAHEIDGLCPCQHSDTFRQGRVLTPYAASLVPLLESRVFQLVEFLHHGEVYPDTRNCFPESLNFFCIQVPPERTAPARYLTILHFVR